MTNRQKYLPCIGGLRIKMTYSRGCYLFYLAAFCVPSAHFAQTDFDVKHISDHELIERSWRAIRTAMHLAKKGALAVKSLTGDAVVYPPSKLPSNPANSPVRQFQKKGDYSRAIGDLNAVFPDRIKDFSTLTGSRGKLAIIGDRLLFAKSSNEFTGFPTIEILQVGGVKPGSEAKVKLTDLITYIP